MNILRYLSHPEELSRETLFLLRQEVAQHPYYQAARLLYLQNLFLLHDPGFGEELRRSALYLPDRTVLYELVEEKLSAEGTDALPSPTSSHSTPAEIGSPARTSQLIEDFLAFLPADDEVNAPRASRAENAADYTSVLMALSDADEAEKEEEPQNPKTQEPKNPKTQKPKNQEEQSRAEMLDGFIAAAEKGIELHEVPEYLPELPDDSETDNEEGFFTETLARVYVKQGRYDKASVIIRQIYLNNPKKSAYFADQLRFLEKLKLIQKQQTQEK